MNKPDQTINDYIQMIDNLERKLEVAVEALEFYGDNGNWSTNLHYSRDLNTIGRDDTSEFKARTGVIWKSGGKRARQALKEIKGEALV